MARKFRKRRTECARMLLSTTFYRKKKDKKGLQRVQVATQGIPRKTNGPDIMTTQCKCPYNSTLSLRITRHLVEKGGLRVWVATDP